MNEFAAESGVHDPQWLGPPREVSPPPIVWIGTGPRDAGQRVASPRTKLAKKYRRSMNLEYSARNENAQTDTYTRAVVAAAAACLPAAPRAGATARRHLLRQRPSLSTSISTIIISASGRNSSSSISSASPASPAPAVPVPPWRHVAVRAAVAPGGSRRRDR